MFTPVFPACRPRLRKAGYTPYQGPPLCELHLVKEVDFHPASTVVVESSCSECAYKAYKEFLGIEKKTSRRHVPREKGKGFFFVENALANCDFFKPRNTELPLCTQEVKEFMEKMKYTNVEFLEVGELLPG